MPEIQYLQLTVVEWLQKVKSEIFIKKIAP